MCLGVQFNTVQTTMSVTPEHLEESESLLGTWLVKRSATKTEVQSLVGKLFFISKCVRQGRLFLSRILALLRTLKCYSHHRRLAGEFCQEIVWWLRFMRIYNGVSPISSLSCMAPDTVFSRCLFIGMRWSFAISVLSRGVFPSSPLPLWGHLWTGLRIQVFCDNAAVVSALVSGKMKNQLHANILCDIKCSKTNQTGSRH